MKNSSKYIIATLAILLLASCKEEVEKPKVTYDTTNKDRSEGIAEPNKILVADLPVQMEGTSVLLYPVGEFSVSNGNSKSKYSS